MKKMLLKFADNVLSKEQMKQVKGGHCPRQISQEWCTNTWSNPCGPGCISVNTAGYNACMNTCQSCNNGVPC